MTILLKPYFTRYSNSESINFADNALSILNGTPFAAIEPQVRALQTAFDEINASFKKEVGNAKTQDLKTLDERRDKAVRGIKGIAENYLLHFDEAKVKAADAILRSMNKYAKNIHRLGYSAQTAVVNNLLEDWANEPAPQAGIALLGLTEWKEEMETANKEFDAVFIMRNKEEALKDKVASATQVRIGLEEAYREVETHLNAHAVLNPSPEVETIMGELNKLIKKYNAEAQRTPAGTEGEGDAPETEVS
ncbi:MAG: DUF6261 family protein [Bacteroidota bacterium]